MADGQITDGTHDAKDVLLRTDEGFRLLVTEHHALDQQIHRLTSQTYLTDQQRFEETALKKRKLALKDRIEAIVRQHHVTQH